MTQPALSQLQLDVLEALSGLSTFREELVERLLEEIEEGGEEGG